MKYFEIEFSNEPRNQDNSEGDTVGDYSICIIADRKPSEEAADFCSEDMRKMGYKYVVNVLEICEEEAHSFFDMEKEKDFPVFK